MGIHFVDPEENPQPPELVRFRNVSFNIYPDKRRLRLKVDITPFQEPPNMEVKAFKPSGEQAASASVIGMNSPNLELTLHLRGEISAGDYVLNLQLGYYDNEPVDHREVPFVITEI